MLQERTQRVEAIFDAALALPADERAAFVARACAEDAALRAEVNRLLENDSRASENFLSPPPPDPRLAQVIAADRDTLPAGTRIGGYTIKSLIATGGMGTVYLAEQANPRRDVALKVLHAGMWSASARQRFEHESQILARLQHSKIAQVYEAGRAAPSPPSGEGRGEGGTEGRPQRSVSYFAMEFVPNARRITEYANEHQLDIRARLELFLQVCDAVQYGHQKGIIHRDLKPANILVGADGAYERTSPDSSLRASVPACLRASVKVIDFGVARVVDTDVAMTTMHTETGHLIGTLAYMSPEQCDADPLGLDVRSDVYSLGVVLYELLCGKMPYDVSKTSIVAAARTIRETDPVRPSVCSGRRFGGRNSRDLETIILKALEKDRTRRYASIADLARDIRRYVNREPIDARPQTAFTRVLRWAIRHPKASSAIAASTIALTIVTSTIVSVWWVNTRPHRIVLTDRGQECVEGERVRTGERAVLYSLNGRPLMEWSSSSIAGISLAAMTKRPARFGGGRIILMGFRADSAVYTGELCAFDADGPYDKPLWSRSIEVNQLPTDLKDAGPSRWGFGVVAAWLMDVFPEDQSPGEEIVVVFGHAYSRRSLRIYNLGGDVLYQVWQDGGMENASWLQESRLLIFAGGNEDAKEAIRDARVVNALFALRPMYGLISREYVDVNPGEGPLQPVWYRYLFPPASSQMFWTASLPPCREIGSQTESVDVRVEVIVPDGPPPRFHFTVDASGRETNEARRLGDSWRKCPYPLPPIDAFQLRDDPPTDIYHPPPDTPAATTQPPAAPAR